ncbi:hypothetical protein [Pseudanabaena sp. BC1403]|nr:hypothetical protein [Pseudanabaena sp. BC1403]
MKNWENLTAIYRDGIAAIMPNKSKRQGREAALSAASLPWRL